MVVLRVRQERRRGRHERTWMLTRFCQTYPPQLVVLIAALVYCKWLPGRSRFCAYYLALKWRSAQAPNSSVRDQAEPPGAYDR
jgi:hypothetical protein